MSNALYEKGKEGLLDGSINFITDNIKAVLIDLGSYTPSLGSHSNLSDIPSGARVAISGNLSSKTATLGVADAADIILVGVSGASIEAVAIFKDTGTPSTSRLLALVDTASSGLPITPNGGDITLQWSNGSNKIFKL